MSAQIRKFVKARFGVRRLLAIGAVLLSGPGALLSAQDTRTVVEPTFPTTCTALAATQAITNGGPTSETAFDTSRIQTALNACASGQAVELTLGGTNNVDNAFLIAPINIPNGVTLIVDGGVTVFASRNPADYQATGSGVETCGTVGTAGNGCNPLITVNNGSASSGSGIMGYGIINGRGGSDLILNGVVQTYSWWNLATTAGNTAGAAQNNPILMYPRNASNFTLYKITLINSPMFHVKYQYGTGFTVWGVKIVTPYSSRNTDGIDPDDSVSNMTINLSNISDGDDDVALGATSGHPVTNVTIENTHTYSGHGLSIGSNTAGGVSNVYVNNINQSGNLSDTNSAGLKIKSAEDRGGLVNNVSYNNVCIQNIRYPLQFNPNYDTTTGTSYPSYQNIAIHGVSVVGIAAGQDEFDGFSANFPLGLTLDNLNITGTQPANTPAPQYTNFTIGPGPVNPTTLQTLRGTGITYTGNITNPTEAAHACPSTNFPFLAGELYLSTTTLNNQRTLSVGNPGTFTLNAMVEPTEASSSTPTSAIQFYEGTTLVGTGALGSNGTLAQLTLTGVASGAHTYTARYPADSAYAAFPFGSVTVNVNTTATTTTMTANPTSTNYGANVALTATVVAASGNTTPTGTVSFQSGDTVFGTMTLNGSGVAVLNSTTLPVGTNAISAYFQGSTNFGTSNSSASPVSVTIAQSGSVTTVVSTPTPAAFGSTITMTATVNPASNASGQPTGTVTFLDGSTSPATTLGSATLSGNSAVLTISTLAAGVHTITAVYGGDVNFTTSTSAAAATETIFTVTPTVQLGFTSGTVSYGASATMIATLLYGGATATAATGTITFTDGGNPLATVAVSGGSASFTTSSLSIGTHNIVATYSGDSNYAGPDSSAATPLVVKQAGTTTTVGATSATITYGSGDSFTATVSPTTSGTPTGTVTFMDGTTPLGSQTLSGGTATLSVSTLTGGTHSITVVYGGDVNFTGSSSTALAITVTQAASSTAVSVPAPITYGSSALLSAMVSSTVAGTPTGTVTFKDGTTTLGTGTVSGGAASFTANGLTGGTHSITAVYSGDGNYAGSTSSAATLTVNKASTSATIGANPATINYGASTLLTGTVTPTTATGSITFQDSGVTIGTGTISNGVATFTATTLAAGTHTLTAIYSGDTNYNGSTTATAATVTVSQIGSTTLLNANPTTLAYLSSTLLTATVPSTATGTVTFKDSGTAIGTGTVSSGVATFTATSLAGGSHSISAVYGGDTNYLGSTSSAVTVTVNPASSTTTVTANPSMLAYGSSTLLTATLANTTGTGTMTFKDGTNTLGTGTITGGSASFTASSLAGGTHSITAVYSGDTNFAGSTSSAITVTVTLATTTTTVTATPQTIAFGGSTTLKATISNASATGSVTFKDGTTTLGSGTVSAGSASFTATGLIGGTHNITAVYSGDGNYATSTSAATVVTVNTEGTTTSVAANPATTTYGASVTLTATILPAGGTPSATGTVTFKDGGTTIGTGTVTNGGASLTLSTLSTGTHSITASYSGDGNYAGSASTSITVTINPVTPTVTLAANPSSITFGGTVTLTATILPSTVTGTVTFKDSGVTIGTVAVPAGGVAAFSISTLTGGSHSITACYTGDVNDTAVCSSATSVSVGLAATATTLGAQPSSLSFGATTTLTATVAPASATGTVTFKDGATILGSPTLSAGAASLAVSTLSVGTHSITAVYSGDGNNATSTSSAVTVTVALAPTTATIAATPSSASYGTATNITVTIAPSAATGTVTIKDGTTTLGTATLTSGVGTLSVTLAAGTHTLSASYSGDANYAASSTTTSATVTIAVATTTTVAAGNPSSTALGFATTLSASVTPAAATGTVTFKDTSTGLALGTAALAGGTGSITGVVLSPAGAHTITATYSGDSNDAGSSGSTTVTITPGATVVTLANSPASPVIYGTSVTLSTTNTTVLGVAPTGTVQYLDGTTPLGSAPITLNASNVPVSGFTLATLMPGTHSLTAVYSGDGNYATTTSAAVSFTVNQATSTTTMAVTPPQTVPGQTFTLTATVASTTGTGTPTGTVTFYNQSNASVGTATLVGGVASITQAITPLGTYTYTASYSGNVDFTASTSAASPTTVIVKQLADTTTVSATPTSGSFGATTYTVTAVVTPASGGPATGSVTFTDGVNVLGTLTLPSSDTVSLTNLTLAGGVHTITAAYSGDPVYVLSTSATPAVITVNTAPTATTMSATPATSTFGTSVTLSAAVTNATGTMATGTVRFMNGSALLGTGTLNGSGMASFTTTTLPIAVYSVTAVYSGDTNFTGSTSAATTVTVNKIPQTITLTGVPASIGYGALPFPVVDSASSGLTVTLAVSGPATLSGSTLTITGAGTVTVTATQAGNATYAAATTVTDTMTVTPAPLTVTVNNATIAYGAAIPTFTGTISGLVNGDSITATYTTTATSSSVPGTYPITATLVDPGNRLGNYTVTNPGGTLTISVSAQAISFPAPPSTVVYGVTPIALTATASSNLAVVYTVTGPATVSGATLTITGSGTVVVTATQPGNAIYSAATSVSQTIAVSKAALTVTAANATRAYGTANPTFTGTVTGVVGSDGITATYSTAATTTSAVGAYPITPATVDPNNRLSNYNVTLTPGTLTVTAAATTVTLGLSATQIYTNYPLLLTATLNAPSGTVTFLSGTTALGTGTVSGGVATLTVSNLGVGTYSITASFAASGNYAAGVSSAQTLTVVAPVVLALSPASLSLAAGGSGTSTMTLTPSSGFTGAVTLGCTSPVTYVTCTVTSPVTISGTTAGTATITINVAATYGDVKSPPVGPERSGPSAAALAALLPFGALLLAPMVRRRKSLRLLAMLAMAAGMGLVFSGCGGGSASVTPSLPPAGAQTITVTATASSTTITTSLTVNITN